MKQVKRIVAGILLIIAVVSLIIATIITIQYIVEDKQAHDAIVSIPQPTLAPTTPAPASEILPSIMPEPPSEVLSTATPDPTASPIPAIPNPYINGYLSNEDMVGWLTIPGTVIDYPVMWTPEDENYYLYRDFDKKDNKNGSLILDTDSSLDPLTTNLIIHGHNMKSGAMFGNLTDYENKEYYLEHPQIILHTKECQRNYEIIAVFRSQVYKKSDNVFKYYKFFQAETQKEFDEFYENIKKLSMYDTGVNAEFGDNFITLSTCVYHVTNGRFVVVAKEVAPGNYYIPIE